MMKMLFATTLKRAKACNVTHDTIMILDVLFYYYEGNFYLKNVGITKVQETASPWNYQRIRDGRCRETTARIYNNIVHMQFTVELQSGSVLM